MDTDRSKGRIVVATTAYWGLWFLFALTFFASVSDVIMFQSNSETYRRVYQSPGLQQAIAWAFVALSGAAIASLAVGIRERRVSVLALLILALFVGFAVADHGLGIVRTCCD